MVVSHYVIENITSMSTPRFFLADPLAQRFETYQTNPDWMLSMTGSMLETSEKQQKHLKWIETQNLNPSYLIS